MEIEQIEQISYKIIHRFCR